MTLILELLARIATKLYRRLRGLPTWTYTMKGLELDAPGLRNLAVMLNDLAERADRGELTYQSGGIIIQPTLGTDDKGKWYTALSITSNVQFKVTKEFP